MSEDLKQELAQRLRQVGAYDVRIADPRAGFEKILDGKHPLELWKECKSVVVFAIAMSPKANNTYAGPYAPWQGERNLGPIPVSVVSTDFAMDRLSRLFISSITLKGITFLQERGFRVCLERTQAKLCAYESGLGIYGRSGVILHPDLGNRMSIGIILTDAPLEADPKLEGFAPCEKCDLCVKLCPAQAYDSNREYPDSWSREKCMSKRSEIANQGLFCHNCFAVCPARTHKDDDLLSTKDAVSFYKKKGSMVAAS